MAISKTEIVNKSLTLLGASPIVNLSDDSKNARILNRVYDMALRSILSSTKWTFAYKRVNLATLANSTPAWSHTVGETIVYQRPSDVIRIYESSDPDSQWRVEGEQIISDTTSLGIGYIYFLDDPTKYSASFTEAFSDKLASDIAYMVLNSTAKAKYSIEKYETISLPTAQAENAQIGTQQLMKDDEWTLAKYGGNENRSPGATS